MRGWTGSPGAAAGQRGAASQAVTQPRRPTPARTAQGRISSPDFHSLEDPRCPGAAACENGDPRLGSSHRAFKEARQPNSPGASPSTCPAPGESYRDGCAGAEGSPAQAPIALQWCQQPSSRHPSVSPCLCHRLSPGRCAGLSWHNCLGWAGPAVSGKKIPSSGMNQHGKALLVPVRTRALALRAMFSRSTFS